MNSANKVAEIFTAAGLAFSTLGKLTMQLHTTENGNTGSKWSDEEIELLRNSIKKFSDELDKLSEVIKEKTVNQIHGSIKKKSMEVAGVTLGSPKSSGSHSSVTSSAVINNSHQTVVVVPQPPPIVGKSTAEVTLNMLNTSESEVDVEALNFEGANEVVP